MIREPIAAYALSEAPHRMVQGEVEWASVSQGNTSEVPSELVLSVVEGVEGRGDRAQLGLLRGGGIGGRQKSG